MSLKTANNPLKKHAHELSHDANMPTRYIESFARLANNRVIFISEDITKETSSAVSALLLYYDHANEDEEITIYINSNGGDLFAMHNMYDVMHLTTAPIRTVCIGKAYSAGAFLLAAGTKGRRFITENAAVMIHGIQCKFPSFEESSQVDSDVDLTFLEQANLRLFGGLAKHTGKSLAKIQKDCIRDLHMSAQEALKYGIVDHIIGE